MLSYVRGQTRIVDLRIDSGDPDDWLHAYALAARTAAADPRTCELVAFGSTESVNRILEQNGFRVRGRRPVFLRDAANLLGEPTALHLNMLDDDSAYIDVPGYPYVT